MTYYFFDSISLTTMIFHAIRFDCRLIQHGQVLFEQVQYPLPNFLDPDNTQFLRVESLVQQQTDHYHYVKSDYGLGYLAVALSLDETRNAIIISGPFLSENSSPLHLQQIMIKNSLTVSERSQLEHFYQSLPVINEEEIDSIGTLLFHLSLHPSISPVSQNHITDFTIPVSTVKDITEENRFTLERRYQEQNQLMRQIATGNFNELRSGCKSLIDSTEIFRHRVVGNPLRAKKNMGFVLNTMCRIAAENGGVHPIYLHEISEKYAISIEKAVSIQSLKQLMEQIPEDYALLVHKTATKNFSPTIRQALDYIQLHLGHALSLTDIANAIPVNPSHLSRKFKKEVGQTITQYLNNKRIDEACFYLQEGKLSVTEIAYLVGYSDQNYFIKTFKKKMGVTPKQFRKQMPEKTST